MSLDATEDAIVGTLKQSLVISITFGSCECVFGKCFHEPLFSLFFFPFCTEATGKSWCSAGRSWRHAQRDEEKGEFFLL